MTGRELAIAAVVTAMASPFAIILGMWLAWEISS